MRLFLSAHELEDAGTGLLSEAGKKVDEKIECRKEMQHFLRSKKWERRRYPIFMIASVM